MKAHSSPLLLVVLMALFQATMAVHAAQYYVAVDGDDQNPGTLDSPFRTLSQAVSRLTPGDTALVRGGVYRETVVFPRSGTSDAPIRLAAYPGEKVLLDGREILGGRPRPVQPGIIAIAVDHPVEQLFRHDEMLFEARWPNVELSQVLSRTGWSQAQAGSRYGRLVDSHLSGLAGDLRNVDLVLNGAHQFFTWRVPARRSEGRSDTLVYSKNLRGLANKAEAAKSWEDDYYYLAGDASLLDVANEFFFDAGEKTLYLHAKVADDLDSGALSYKAWDYGIVIRDLRHNEVEGISFFATTLSVENCKACQFKGLRLEFPTHASDPDRQNATFITGRGNVIEDSVLVNASGGGIAIRGESNRLDNVLVSNTSWYGSLRQPAVALTGVKGEGGEGNVLRNSTIRGSGSVLVKFSDGPHRVENNKIHDGGLLSRDVSLVYTSRPGAYGSVVRRNWVFNAGGDEGEGIGIRGDDRTRGLSILHNVVWGCGQAAIVIKGDQNKVIANTLLGSAGKPDRAGCLIARTDAEPLKPWKNDRHGLPQQNANSVVANNIVTCMLQNRRGEPVEAGKVGTMCGNVATTHPRLENGVGRRFVPLAGSGLVDSGCTVGGLEDPVGDGPDVGAYELGAAYWEPGSSLRN